MSSHHIVREKQEPALIILSTQNFEEEYLGQLLEWSPTVIVAENVIDEVQALGIKIDIIVSRNINYQSSQENVKIIFSESDALEDALKYLIAEGYPAVNIISKHFETKDYLFYADLIDLVIFNHDKKIYPIKSGFSKWQSEGEDIYIFNLELIREFSYDGLQKVGPDLFKTEKDGFYSLTFQQPQIFIAEQL
ncbi:MAG: thiamine pyrophosphokinase [Bacteroidetes bacterium]|nr:thiamine pyrophosphokinase [Bacteroidota bacterium]MBU1373751.1 thiamine pyrophosphokinase [Bacteroidota bacterium]MBU1486145.1 thiamine pyrophosphokinase [Bacteroidota bacterium]MBU1761212.1 thiamine pyrophosphokinase [Bacteroidota bacterium]MBU2045330.1 thiamine pyrophosphokinase [Bacteroidota bacterium]